MCSVRENLGGGTGRDGTVEPAVELGGISTRGDLLPLLSGGGEVPGVEELLVETEWDSRWFLGPRLAVLG